MGHLLPEHPRKVKSIALKMLPDKQKNPALRKQLLLLK